MRQMKWLTALLVAAGTAMSLSIANADDGCCSHCGHNGACRKVCRLVEEEKKVEIVCWGTKCEEFCAPCCSKKDCEYCEEVCGECDPSDPNAVHAKAKKFIWRTWIPGSARMYTKKKLMKKVITKKIPSHKWVVEDMCAGCEASVAASDEEK